MGGWKTSGLGTRHGSGGIRKYTKQQTLLVTRLALKKDLAHVPLQRQAQRAPDEADPLPLRARQAHLTGVQTGWPSLKATRA